MKPHCVITKDAILMIGTTHEGVLLAVAGFSIFCRNATARFHFCVRFATKLLPLRLLSVHEWGCTYRIPFKFIFMLKYSVYKKQMIIFLAYEHTSSCCPFSHRFIGSLFRDGTCKV